MIDRSNLLDDTYQLKNRRTQQRLNALGLDELAIFIRFNNGHIILLSTLQHCITSEKLSSTNVLFNQEQQALIRRRTFFLGDAIKDVSMDYGLLLDSYIGLHCDMSIIRRSAECDFFCTGFMNNKKVQDFNNQKDRPKMFEIICADYLQAFIPLIIQIETDYRYSMIFNNHAYLMQVIVGGSNELLTLKERECLSMALSGASFKGIAKALRISDTTVKYHCQNIRKKMAASSLMEAAVMALFLGEIGCLKDVAH